MFLQGDFLRAKKNISKFTPIVKKIDPKLFVLKEKQRKKEKKEPISLN